MEINFNIPSVNQLFGQTSQTQESKNASRAVLEGSNALPGSTDALEKEDILTYFYHHFSGQAKIEYTAESNMPKAELDINLSIEILFQTKINREEDFKTLEEMAKELTDKEGFFGEEATSDRLFESAKAFAGDNPKELSNMKKAIQKGFAKAESIAGTLPELSHKTLATTLSKIDNHITSSTSSRIDITA